jgi:hypothetical protein
VVIKVLLGAAFACGELDNRLCLYECKNAIKISKCAVLLYTLTFYRDFAAGVGRAPLACCLEILEA